ncbi:MAG: DMT family transporter [Calditrichaceae bacterium]|nr:DMT family transporter [Calditrichaceae bacterium]MBN2708457.1 DMT family transporter [Calditrichaceae bacterium]RQV93071.1 MAG: DMT family transporter [Calditrichota bacterium]
MTRLKADLGLMSITVFWGTTFIISKLILTDIPVSLYLAIRLVLAALILNFIIIKSYHKINRIVLRDSIILGFLMFFTFFFQMKGIIHTTASNAGFITGLSVILVPIIGFIFLKTKPALNVIIGIFLALAGLLLLTGADPSHWNQGDILVLICSFFAALHIIYTGMVSIKHDVYLLTGIQVATAGILSMTILMAAPFDFSMVSFSHLGGLLYLALFGTIYAYLMQTAMQRHTTPARTALIFALEPLFAALFAMAFSLERLTSLQWTGGILIVLSMILAEIWFPKFKKIK